MLQNTYGESIIFTEKSQLCSFLEKIVDDVEDFRCDCKISETCHVCETKRWMQMLQQYNGTLQTQQLPTFPEENYNIPLYLSKVYEIIHAIFIFKSAAIKNMNNQEDEFFKIRSDNESLKVKAKRLQEDIDSKVKQIGQMENQITLISKQTKQGNDKLSQEKEELNQKIIKLQNKVQVMQNEFKKKELEFLKMKDQLRSKDRITYANRYDSMPLKSSLVQQNGFDTWVATRKSLIDELCLLQDTVSGMLQILNHFFAQLNNFEPINPDIIKMPLHSNKCILWLKQCLSKFNGNLTIDESFLKDLPIMTNSFTDQPLTKLNCSHSKANSITNSGKKDTFKIMNRSQTLHFQQQQKIPDETMSILSRISINEVQLSDSVNSAKFLNDEKPQDKQQLKKWEFVFKQP